MSTEQEHTPVAARAMGRDVARTEAPEKVRGTAPYALEEFAEDMLHAQLVGAPVAKGRIERLEVDEALASPGVHSVLHHGNAPRLASTEDRELTVLQDDRIDFHGQIVAVVLADSPEAARRGAHLVQVHCREEDFDADFQPAKATTRPESANGFDTDTEDGDVEAALAEAVAVVDQTYRTPFEHNMAMEPHAYLARWDGDELTIRDSTQHPHGVQEQLATAFGVETTQVRVIAPHVGGGFGSKGMPHAPDIAAALAARTVTGRAVKLPVTRQQLFALTGYRTATVQRVRLGADAQGHLVALEHQALAQTARIKEFAEPIATPARSLYGSRTRRTSHRLAELDVAVTSWMRAPGVFPGVAGLEMAMDELADELGMDPVELRCRNDVQVDPDTGLPFSERRLVECLRLGAQRFGWSGRQPHGSRVEGDWRIGMGVAAATYPGESQAGNVARIRAEQGGRYTVSIAAADIGTGARTTLGLVAADALGVAAELVDVELGDSSLPQATVAGGSSGTSSWGTAVVSAARAFRQRHGDDPKPGDTTTGGETSEVEKTHARHSYGALFAEVGVNRWTGEVRARRLLGVYSAGRILNPRGARSQFIGGMVMGLGAALLEESVRDPRFGHVVTQDLASYHVPVSADVADIEALWLPGDDQTLNPMGARGVGEIGITGVVPAVVSAVHNATGVRVRTLPIHAADLA